MKVKKLGSYLEVDEQGYLKKLAHASKIQRPWAEAVEAVRQAYLAKWGDAVLHSIYLRGSVAKGCAVEGVSDIDSFAVFREGRCGEPDDAWEEAVEEDIRARFPYVAGVEMYCVPIKEALARESIDALTIKVNAACIHGEDLAGRLEGYKPGPEIAIQSRYFRHHLDMFQREYPLEGEREKRGMLVWIMRRFLRLGMELVMEREERYTRDLYLCYESFVKYYPEKQEDMRRALELAVNPVVNREAESFTRKFGEWLANEASNFPSR